MLLMLWTLWLSDDVVLVVHSVVDVVSLGSDEARAQGVFVMVYEGAGGWRHCEERGKDEKEAGELSWGYCSCQRS